LDRSIVLYDLTNTYFEGQCAHNPKGQFGRSKEKRSDCPLVTLGLVLDGEGFPLSSQVVNDHQLNQFWPLKVRHLFFVKC
jgi:transposase